MTHETTRGRNSPWPKPPERALQHGLAGEIIRTIEPHTEADPIAILLQLLVGAGNQIGRGAHFVVEATPHYPNLFATIVGDTSRARKGTSWGHAKAFLRSVDGDWFEDRIKSGLSSGEGLIEQVKEDGGTSDKRLLIFEGEFARVLKVASRETNILSTIIRQAWDSDALAVLNKITPLSAKGAHISIVGHITEEELRKHLSDVEMANGFANRFLWACVTRARLLPDGGSMHQVDVSSLVNRLRDAIDGGKSMGELTRTAEAGELWSDMYAEFDNGPGGLLGAMTARAEAQVVRLSMLYALLDRSPHIQTQHLLAAKDLWDYCDRSAHYLFGKALGNRTADRILTHLRETGAEGGRTEIHNYLGNKTSGAELDEALELLMRHGLVACRKKKTGGRDAELWRAIEAKEGVETDPGTAISPLSSLSSQDVSA